MNILIINLTRLGDIIQTTPLINGLKEKYPHSCIHYLVFKGFSNILEFIPAVDKIITIDDNVVFNNLQSNFWLSFLEVYESIDFLKRENYDLIINPIADKRASLIVSNINPKKTLGFLFKEDYEYLVRSSWSCYHLASERITGQRSFNLVDIFTRTGEVNSKIENFRINPTKEKSIQRELLNVSDDQALIGIHIGASNSNKTWSPENFYKLTRLLLFNDYKVILFGGLKEKHLADVFKDIQNPNFINLVGKTNLDELINHINAVDLMVSNDTGPSHISIALGKKIINISLGPVSFWETGPYTLNCIVVEANMNCRPCNFKHKCSHLDCHNKVTPEIIKSCIENLLSDEKITLDTGRVNVWKPLIDPFGFFHYVPSTKKKLAKNDLLFEIKRLVWCLTMSKLKNHFGDSDLSDLVNKYFTYLENFYDFTNFFNLTDELSEEYKDYLSKILQHITNIETVIKRALFDKNIDKSKELGIYLKLKTELKNILGEHKKIFQDFYDYSVFCESTIESDDLSYLLKETLGILNILKLQFFLIYNIIRSKNENYS